MLHQRAGRGISSKHVYTVSKRHTNRVDDDLLGIARHVRRLHYKYLAARVIAKWKRFAHERLATVRARRHYTARTLARAWLGWRVFHAYSKRAQRNELISLIQFKFSLQRRCWRAWWLCVMQHRAGSALWAFAVRRVAKNIEYRAFTTWLTSTRMILLERNSRWEHARKHHSHGLLRTCLEMWKAHHAEWKQHWLALMHHHTQLERHALRRWHAQVLLRTRIRAMRRTVLLRTARMVIGSAFSAWRSYVRMRGKVSDIQHSTVEYSNTSTMKRCFGIWNKKYEEAQRDRWMWVQAVVFHESKIKEKVIISFRHYSIEKQSKRTATHMANYFHKRKLAIQYLDTWRTLWTAREKERKDRLNEEARCHFRKVALRKGWDNWRSYHQRKATTRGPLRRANAHYRKAILGKLLVGWWRLSTYHRDVLNLGGTLAARHHSHLLSQVFAHWYSTTLRKQTRNTHRELALHSYNRALKRRALRMLREVAARGAVRQRQRYAAVRLRYRALLRVAWQGWREYVSLRREKHTVWRTAEVLHGKFVGQKCLEVWLDYVSSRRVVRLMYAKAVQHRRKQIGRQVLVEWQKCVERRVHKRYLLSRAARHLLSRMKRNFFQHWRLFAVTHSAHAQYKRAMYLRALVHMSKLLQRRIFLQWTEIHNHLKVRRIANQQARAHRTNFVLARHFASWRRHAVEQKEYAALRMRAARFWLRKRLSNAIVTWRDWVAEHRRMRTESALAVRHWSIRVKWSAWVAWRVYTQKKRAGLMRKGMDMYKAHVTKAAATHWLKIGFSTRTARMQYGMQREAQYAATLFTLVDKFARRWRNTVARRKRERLQGIFTNKMTTSKAPTTNPTTTTYQPLLLNYEVSRSLTPTQSFQPFRPPLYPPPNVGYTYPTFHPPNHIHTSPHPIPPPINHTNFPPVNTGASHTYPPFIPVQPLPTPAHPSQPLPLLPTPSQPTSSQPTPSQPPFVPPPPPSHVTATAQHAEIIQIEQELLQFAQLKQQLEDSKKKLSHLLLHSQAHTNHSSNSAEVDEGGRGENGEIRASEEISTLEQQVQSLSEMKRQRLPHIKHLYSKIVQLKQTML